MSYDEEIKKLEETRNELVRFSSELDAKVSRNEMNRIEYSLMMHEKLCGKDKSEVLGYIESQIAGLKRKAEQEEQAKRGNKKLIAISAATIVLILMAMIGIIMTNPGALTGYVVKSVHETTAYERTFDNSTETQLELTGITGFRISGTLTGERAVVKLRTESIEYLVGEIVNTAEQTVTREYSLRTDKTTYALGERAQIIITPEGTEASVYVTHNNNTEVIVTNTTTKYIPAEIGEYSVVAVISDSIDIVRLETSFSVVNNITNETEQLDNTASQTITETTNETNGVYSFEAVCVESCSIPETSNPILVVELAEGATLTITNISLSQNKENQAPSQTKTLPDIVILAGQEKMITLDDYFTDPDDSTIYYDVSAPAEIQTSIDQDELTISSDVTGTYSVYVYASDESELVVSNIFLVTITDVITNESLPPEPTEDNITGNESDNITLPITEPITLPEDACSNPNPNFRPAECIEGNEEEYFKNKAIYIENYDRSTVARVTTFGNFMITGMLIEDSTGAPGPRDFRVSYFVNDGETEISTAWIDTETGDLHLRGRVYEEQFNLVPSGESFMIQNRKNTNLGYFDRITGDLYLRGNLVQERTTADVTVQ